MLTKQETWDKLVKLGKVSGDMPDKQWDLVGVNLEKADLSNANLEEADLRFANLRGANLRGANISYTDLGNANLRGANLKSADLREAYLSKANLRGANLIGASINGANLTEANLTGANINCSCWPLWCGSLKAVVDERILKQIGYHWLSLMTPGKIKELGLEKAVEFVNKFHQVENGDCPEVKIGE